MRCSVRELPLAFLRADGDLRHLRSTGAGKVLFAAAHDTDDNFVICLAVSGRPMLAEYTVLDIFVGEAQLPELANGGDDAHDLR